MQLFYLCIVGIAAGILSGMFGVGGGTIIVPALVFLFGMSQHTASATSLVAMLLPVGVLGVAEYYRSGTISSDNIRFGLIISVGLFIGVFFGARIATHLSSDILRKLFSIFIGIVAIRLWFQ